MRAHTRSHTHTHTHTDSQALEGLRRKGFYSMLQAQLDVILALLSNSKTQ
jgi:hypothetical protein